MFEHSAVQAAWFLPQLTQLLHSPAAALLPAIPILSFLKSGSSSSGPETGRAWSARTDPCPWEGPRRNVPVSATIAITEDDYQICDDLVSDRYAWRGYGTAKRDAAASQGQREVTLLAWAESDAVGTMTMGFDGGGGLLADQTYGSKLDVIRAQGRTICEFTRFAVAAGADSRATLWGLFDLSYVLGRQMLGVTDAVVEVNPRHVGFYRRAFGFEAISDVRTCERVSAPAVLLRLDVARMEERMRATGARTPGQLALA
jgi:hypothetical protein